MVLFQLEHSPDDDPDVALAYHAAEDEAGRDVVAFAGELVLARGRAIGAPEIRPATGLEIERAKQIKDAHQERLTA